MKTLFYGSERVKKVYIVIEYHNNYDYGGESRELSYHSTYYSAVIGVLKHVDLPVTEANMKMVGTKGCFVYDQFHGIEIGDAKVEELTMEEGS